MSKLNLVPSAPGVRHLARLVCWAALAGLSPATLAQGLEAFRVSGFGTLGLTDAVAPHGWGLRRDLGQSGSSEQTRGDVDSRIGLQLNYRPVSQVEFVTQFLAARGSPAASLGDKVTWAFVALNPTPESALRFGRVNLDAFLMSDHRDVGLAYPQARPPVEFYGLLPTSLDGGDVSRWVDIGDSRWRFKLYGGRTPGGDRGSNAAVRVAPTVGGLVSRESDGLLIRLGAIRAGVATSPAPLEPLIAGLTTLGTLPLPNVASEAQALRERVDPAGSTANYLALGAKFDSGPWLWSAELARVSGHPFYALVGGYASVGRRFGDWTVHSTFSRVRASAAALAAPQWSQSLAFDPALAAQAQALGSGAAMVASQGPRQHTWSVGARWDLHPQIAVKFQWDQISTEANGAVLWTHASVDSGRSRVASVLLDFVF